MSDLIDRQAAIDALDAKITVTGRENAEAVRRYVTLIVDRIVNLPSALSTNLTEVGTGVPDINVGDMISRQAVKELLNNNGLPYHINPVLWKELNELPSAQPELKRGKWIDRGEHGDWEWQADGRGKHWHEWECNTCHHYFAERSFFCPHCGSDMR